MDSLIEKWARIVDDADERDGLVCEMANKYREETLLPMNIWIDETGSYVRGRHGKRIRFQLDKSDYFDNDNTGSMGLDGTVYPPSLKIRDLMANDIEELRNFVRNNRHALDLVADQKVRLYKVWPYIIKGGKAASDDEVERLNAKVDELAHDSTGRN